MTLIALHGNFETPVIWSEFVDAYPGKVLTPNIWELRQNGGGPVNDADGIVEKIAVIAAAEASNSPVHMVGRNLSSAMLLRLVSKYRGLVTSFCVDAIGWTHPSFVFAPMTESLATSQGQAEFRHTFLEENRKGLRAAIALSGIDQALSDQRGDAVDDDVVEASPALYGEGPEFRRRWREDLGVGRSRGLVLNLERPLFGDRSFDGPAAARLGLEMVSLDMGRLWCATHPSEAADIIAAFIADPPPAMSGESATGGGGGI